MAKAPILGGNKTVDLDDEVFGAPFNGPLVHEVVVAELAARRQGTHATRTRGMVSGGGARRAPAAPAPAPAAPRCGPAAAPSSAPARATTR
jgi:ribosomal protein L4